VDNPASVLLGDGARSRGHGLSGRAAAPYTAKLFVRRARVAANLLSWQCGPERRYRFAARGAARPSPAGGPGVRGGHAWRGRSNRTTAGGARSTASVCGCGRRRAARCSGAGGPRAATACRP